MGYHTTRFAAYMTVPATVLAVDGLTGFPNGGFVAEASVAEPLACVLNGQKLADRDRATNLAVVGAGRSAACTCCCRSRGAARIVLV